MDRKNDVKASLHGTASGVLGFPRVRNVGGVFSQCTPDFNRGPLWGVSRCLKANMNDAAVLIEFEYESD